MAYTDIETLHLHPPRVNPSLLHIRALTDNTVPLKISLNESACHSRQHSC